MSQQSNLQLTLLTLEKASDEGIITWLSLGDTDLQEATHSLLSINSRIQNSGMIWDGNTTVHNRWGDAPTQIMPLKVSLSINLDADSIHIFPLDETGNEHDYFTIYPSGDESFNLDIDQREYQTPWFGIQAFLKTTPVKGFDQEGIRATLIPNPASERVILEYQTKSLAPLIINLYDWQGKLVRTWDKREIGSQNQQISLSLNHLPSGLYLVQILSTNQLSWQGKLIKL